MSDAPKTHGRLIRWARSYDMLNHLFFLGRERGFRQRVVELAGIEPGETVLDVGCGTGTLAMVAKERVGSDGTVHGIDAAPQMIREAQRKAARDGLDVRFQTALIEDLPFPDGSFDVVLSSLMLHHLPPDLKRRGVAEIVRLLKPGGRFCAVDFDPPWLGNLRVVEEAMEANGFLGIRRGKVTRWLIHYLAGTVEDVAA
jgi:ubiquinone/menaquinone biosynthesis C-methylase UbiE